MRKTNTTVSELLKVHLHWEKKANANFYRLRTWYEGRWYFLSCINLFIDGSLSPDALRQAERRAHPKKVQLGTPLPHRRYRNGGRGGRGLQPVLFLESLLLRDANTEVDILRAHLEATSVLRSLSLTYFSQDCVIQGIIFTNTDNPRIIRSAGETKQFPSNCRFFVKTNRRGRKNDEEEEIERDGETIRRWFVLVAV